MQTEGDPHAWALWTACSVFFAAIVVFLIVTHRRAARDTAKLALLEKRLDEAERK
jgi:hypothetical protein